MPDPAEVYRDELIRIRRIVGDRTERAWRDLGRWDREDVPRFLAVVLPLVAAGQRRTVSLTDAYLARMLGRRALGVDATNLIGAGVRAGADPATVYTRPFIQLWSALSNGSQFTDAVSAAGARASGSAQTDISLSMRATAKAVDEATPPAERPYRWIRVPSGESCGLCVTASTQLYKSPDLLPIHDRCDCGIEPVTRDSANAAKDRNREMLSRLKSQDSYTTKAADLKRLRVDDQGNFVLPEPVVHDHGELGAVLAEAGQTFTGPAAVR